MGSYARLYVGSLELTASRSDVDPTVVLMFSQGDLRVSPFDPDGIAFYGLEEGEAFVSYAPDYQPTRFIRYEADLGVIKDRLEFMGFTLDGARREFQAGLEERLRDLDSYQASYPALTTHETVRRMSETEREVLTTVTFDDWLDAYASIIEGIVGRGRIYWDSDHPEHQELPPLIRFVLQSNFGGHIWFPSYDFRAFMHAAVEIVGTDYKVVYDLTELIEDEEDLSELNYCDWARRQMADEFVLNHKVVVLTEGSTDREAIEGALRLLYPHLAEFYSFMDFSGARLPGGAGSLVGIIKAFVGTGIVNRIVALLDNDTAARDALRALRDVKLPPNVRVLHYPEVAWAKSYPTLGPQGLVDMDVNGLAGSIELYYGSDVLRMPDGAYTPVQWRGYVDALGQYQGQVMRKTALQERFSAKLAACLADPSQVGLYDWSGLNAILERMRTAFHT